MKSFSLSRFILAGTILLVVAGCASEPTPTPDLVATQIAVEKAAHATMTAEAPTLTPTPFPTPTSTPKPTETPTPTMTPTTMPTETPTTTPTMTPTPQPTAIPQPELSVTFRDFHYECQGFRAWTQHYPPNQTVQGYRSFQTLMVVTNNSQNKTLDPPWRPDRWIVTDGNTEWEETYMWQWGPARGEPYELPPVEPGATASWTWLCYPLPQNAWVKSVEFTAWGRTYYFQFPKPSYGDHNYYNCP